MKNPKDAIVGLFRDKTLIRYPKETWASTDKWVIDAMGNTREVMQQYQNVGPQDIFLPELVSVCLES
ncbi:hypothetical protein LTR72_011853 [Exophiala xenobiotica]|nr:hypothetical protein LTR72_011853 [Exophiala xenobiotica]